MFSGFIHLHSGYTHKYGTVFEKYTEIYNIGDDDDDMRRGVPPPTHSSSYFFIKKYQLIKFSPCRRYNTKTTTIFICFDTVSIYNRIRYRYFNNDNKNILLNLLRSTQ